MIRTSPEPRSRYQMFPRGENVNPEGPLRPVLTGTTLTAVTAVPPSTFGIPALRTEDPRFLRGEGRYLENIRIEGSLRAVFVRSIFPPAELSGVEGLDEARLMPGVVAVYTADDLELP